MFRTDRSPSCPFFPIFTFTSTLANAKEPMDLVEPWMKELARVAGADWHAFYILAPDGCTLKCMAASSSDVPPAIMVTLEETSAAARAVRMRQDVWFEASTPLAPSDPLELVSEGTSGLVHGVFLGPSLIGLVALGRRVGHNPFTAGQVNVIHTFSDFLGTQVRNAQVQRESTQHQLMLGGRAIDDEPHTLADAPPLSARHNLLLLIHQLTLPLTLERRRHIVCERVRGRVLLV